ncbi:MAG: DNA polymerase III subunit delta' [Polyangiales bacterium]
MHPPLAGFRSVRGHDAAIELLRRALAADRVASVYLFAGPQGVGKDRVAHALAQTLNCQARTPDGDACGACPPCHKIDAGVHPDLLVLQRERRDPLKDSEAERDRHKRREDIPESELRQNLTVEQVEEVLARMPFRPHEGGSRVVVVREAERLLPQAANKLLKTLEEPPRDTHFVLVTHRPSSLLSTIRSRCQIVRFGLLAQADVAAVLASLEVDAAVAPLGDGSVGRALAFRDAEERARREALKDEVLASLRAGQPGAIVAVGERFKDLDRRDADAVLTLLQRHFRGEAVQGAAEPRRAAVNAQRGDVVREAQELLDGAGNLNVQLTVEAMLVRLREVRP